MIGAGVHINVGRYYYVHGQKKLIRTLAMDYFFQTFTVRLLIEFID